MKTHDVPVLLAAPQAAQLLAISERKLHELRREPAFPKARQLGARSLRWLRSELIEYAESLPRASLLPEPPHLKAERAVGKA
jgi:predicted DNA-binding transcriptional regulator AlpA